jgi:AcrR family transcriptional regulator
MTANADKGDLAVVAPRPAGAGWDTPQVRIRARPAGSRPSRGRPRSEHADRAIMRATLAMLDEGVSVDALSVEAVASRAGVGKATIYRRWPNKQLLVAAAIGWLQEPPVAATGGSARLDLQAVLEGILGWASDSTSGRALPHLLSGMQASPAIKEQYVRTVLEPWMDLLRAALRRGVRAGELDPELDVEMTVLLLFGAVLSRLVLSGRGDPFTDTAGTDLPARIVDMVLSGAGPGPATQSGNS